MRMSDLISQRELRRLDLYHEVLRPLNRDKPFTQEELRLARILGPHLALAHLHAQKSTALKVRFAEMSATLTPREKEVLHWITEGKRDGEIATILGLSRGTVSKHVEHILAKLGCENRLAVIVQCHGCVERL